MVNAATATCSSTFATRSFGLAGAVGPDKPCPKGFTSGLKTKAHKRIGEGPNAPSIRPPNPNIPTHRRPLRITTFMPTMWKPSMPHCDGGWPVIGARPIPMQKNDRLQGRLDVYWLLHNFVRPHFTTKQVPAVALGIVTEGLSVAELFRLPLGGGGGTQLHASGLPPQMRQASTFDLITTNCCRGLS